ncbi:MAG: hypothetical protein DSM107014_16755 [Gomphosphaeria aponina SAG 52.96 = DSM 107014]|uniref:Uncharacterized protein n=1 Tax=Gomphosphaeria aponina SAG 52.96 = DSM 107014 TaxID=1521640 RepID=A0A941GTE2_9CHRO|nr:hypothetical protein [Gomphosphaeria aponina SAG 52.96 = DSM 107014]
MPAIFKVTESSDNGLGNTVGSLSWAIKQANQTPGADEIEITNDVRLNLDPSLKRMQTLINSDIVIKGGGHSISGDNDNDGVLDTNGEDRPILFIKSGNVTLENLTLDNGVAKGGSSNRGGGGAGMGGGLFMYSGAVTLRNVVFNNNIALGGSGGLPGSGAGGGMGGSAFGYGGASLFRNSYSSYGAYGRAVSFYVCS